MTASISDWLELLAQRDLYTAQHSVRTARIAADIARALGLPPHLMGALELGAHLHDIGKLALPREIIHKAGPLSPEEWAVVKTHPRLGDTLLWPFYSHLADVRGVVLYHHERWDGAGYPSGLREEEIPLLARVVAVADAFEAMTSERAYRPTLTTQQARGLLLQAAGLQFDPAIVEAMDDLLENRPFWETWEGFAEEAVS